VIEITHSSLIQLPTDTPPQLIPPTRLPAKLSRRGFSLFELFMAIGRASLLHWKPIPDSPPLTESCLPDIEAKPLLPFVPLRTLARAGRDTSPPAPCSADVRLEVCVCRGELGLCRGWVAMLMGDDGPAMSRSDSDWWKSGKVVSSKSGSSRVESRYDLD